MRKTARFAVAAFAIWSIGLFISPAIIGQSTPNLTGEWRLNKELSDDPAKAMQGMHGGGTGQPGSGGSGGHGPWRHAGGGSGHGTMDAGQMPAMQARVSHAIDAPARLTITHGDGAITLTDGDGRSQTLATNNKKEKRPLDGRMVDMRAKWDAGRLVKETFLDDGMKLTETYALGTEARQLQVMVKLEGSPLPRGVNIRRVYDAEGTR